MVEVAAKVKLQFVIANRPDLTAYNRALGMVQAAAEDLPWRIDLAEAVELLAGVEFTLEPVR